MPTGLRVEFTGKAKIGSGRARRTALAGLSWRRWRGALTGVPRWGTLLLRHLLVVELASAARIGSGRARRTALAGVPWRRWRGALAGVPRWGWGDALTGGVTR
jgi:hypothetical protein